MGFFSVSDIFRPNRAERIIEEEAQDARNAAKSKAAQTEREALIRKENYLRELKESSDNIKSNIIVRYQAAYNNATAQHTARLNECDESMQQLSRDKNRLTKEIEDKFDALEQELNNLKALRDQEVQQYKDEVDDLAKSITDYHGNYKSVLNSLWNRTKDQMLYKKCVEFYTQLKQPQDVTCEIPKSKHYIFLVGYLKQLLTQEFQEKVQESELTIIWGSSISC